MQLGHLRGALRHAILTLDRFGIGGLPDWPPAEPTADIPAFAQARRTVRLISSPRPTVTQIVERIAAECSSATTPSADRLGPTDAAADTVADAAVVAMVPPQRTTEVPAPVSLPRLLVTTPCGPDV
jgi:hypothetical protein